MSPKSILHNLGIKPNRKRKLPARLNKLCEATEHARDGNVPDSDIMNTALMDSSFADEEIARELLNDNFDRLANSMD